MKIRPVGAEMFHADRMTEMVKPTVVSRNFAKALKNVFNNRKYIQYTGRHQ